MIRPASSPTYRSGCGLLLVGCLITCLLLLLNRVLVMSLYDAVVPAHFDYSRLRTIVQFLSILGLLLPQWWLIDGLVRLVRFALRDGESAELEDRHD